jgi:hypothetical protein
MVARRKPGRKGGMAPVNAHFYPSVTAYAVTAPLKGSLWYIPYRTD